MKNHVSTKCKCHGVSGSCTVQTCWRQLSPFNYIGEILKNKYEHSQQVETDNNHANRKTAHKRRSIKVNVIGEKQPPRRMDMIHIDDSPSFCRQSRYSEGTEGRECIKDRNCDSICCGRGYNVQTKTVSRPCKCEVIWCCQFRCQQCFIDEEIHTCKWPAKYYGNNLYFQINRTCKQLKTKVSFDWKNQKMWSEFIVSVIKTFYEIVQHNLSAKSFNDTNSCLPTDFSQRCTTVPYVYILNLIYFVHLITICIY